MKMVVRFVILMCMAAVTLMVDCGAGQSVVDFGAVGDGITDDSQAFKKAWETVCGSKGTPTLGIPPGHNFLIQSSIFSGPCASSQIIIQMLGNIVAPKASAWAHCGLPLIRFANVNGLLLQGSGQINGQGATWWNQAVGCSRPPAVIQFVGCKNLGLTGITSIDSPAIHISVNSCDTVTISNIHIIAPEDSPNTDGIDIGHSSLVSISESFIGTGDDCVAINGGCNGINITQLTCGPGHGISIGSLGDGGPNDSVENVRVQSCTFKGTKAGARIKTLQGQGGYAKSISFTDITLIAAENPILIDQYYCEGKELGCPGQDSTIVVSDVTYRGFRGTSATANAINLDCNKKGCTGLVLDDINITSSVPGTGLQSVCNNAHGRATSTTPTVSCLGT